MPTPILTTLHLVLFASGQVVEPALQFRRLQAMSIASAFVGYLLTIADWKDLWLQTGLVGYLANVSTKHSTGSETEYRYELYRSMQVAKRCAVLWCGMVCLAGADRWVVSRLAQNLGRMEASCPYLLPLCPRDAAGGDTLAGMPPQWEALLELKAPLVVHVLNQHVGDTNFKRGLEVPMNGVGVNRRVGR